MTLRPWKLSGEHPIGAVIRPKDRTRTGRGLLQPQISESDARLIFNEYEWTWPHQQFTGPWWPCATEGES